jgi:predicted glycogen debranching enzyme
MIDFGRQICNSFEAAGSREWLVTNGIGGYASGTIAGVLTRRYHGLLIAALKPPLERTLLVSKLDETALYGVQNFPLFANQWESGAIEPRGFHHLERFHLEGTTPVWTYTITDALLEKRIWMQHEANTTYVRYDFIRGSNALSLNIKAMVDYRDHHASTRGGDWRMQIAPLENGLCITAYDDAVPYYIFSSGAAVAPRHEWYHSYYLNVESQRGLEALDDNLCAGEFHATLSPGQSLTIVASTDKMSGKDGMAAYDERRNYEEELAAQNQIANESPDVQQLTLAADQFIVCRPTHEDPEGHSIIAGYPWFGDWGRDTMIALPGLTLVTGRPRVARSILRTFARFVDQGMLPNRFPEIGEQPEYNTVDATLWYFEALRAYLELASDEALLKELFPILKDIIAWHQRGTRFNIHMDPEDGLLFAGSSSGVQLTWMDAKVDDWVVTPRIGKPVEINALWFNALHIMAQFAVQLGEPAEKFSKAADRVMQSFSRFWNETAHYCFDVIGGPEGDEAVLRPNQLLAVSLVNSPLTPEQQRAVVDVCAQHLLTSHGLRSLAPGGDHYVGVYGGDQHQRDTSYHQGTAWGWLMGPFVQAHLRVYNDPIAARSFLQPLIRSLSAHGVGSISEIFDGDPPFTPRGCIAQAWSVAEVLRAWHLTTR